MLRNVVLIAGPTASGKSRLALEIAAASDGVIVNADSMQVYSFLRILTARPSDEDAARVPHHLFGHVHPATAYSVAQWLNDVEVLIAKGLIGDRQIVFVGGTGLYFRALIDGLSVMPEIPSPIRRKWREALTDGGAAELHRILSERDPRAAARLKSSDGQRIVRALEVVDTSGRSILDWQSDRSQPLVDRHSARKLVLAPERETLRRTIDRRFDEMLEAGAIDEARKMLALALPASVPAMKAIGLRELAKVLQKQMELPDAVERAKAASRQYAKRQDTWFRNQLDADWTRLDPFACESQRNVNLE